MTAPRAEQSGAGQGRGLAFLAAVWFVGFTLYFFSQGLPNNSPWTRPELWSQSPWLILDSLLPPIADPGQPTPDTSGWKYFPQRFGKIAWASLVLIGSWSLGSLLLRGLLRRRRSADVPEPHETLPPIPPGLQFALKGLAGLSAWSLVVLGLGLAGALFRFLFLALLVAFIAVDQVFARRSGATSRLLSAATWNSILDSTPRLAVVCLAAMLPFVMAMALGSLLPSVDFDVKAYHLVGPKEWFQAGRITFLPHNVYTSFPFLTEMQLLSTMVLAGDWYNGGIAGQLVLSSFGIYAAIVVFHLAARFGRTTGWLAAFIYVTTPWVCRISIIAYVEGALAAYLAATLASFLLSRSRTDRLRWTALCGFFAGSAASCKYPGVISALIPFGLLVLVDGFSRPVARIRTALVGAVTFSTAGLVAFGPWLLKNLVQTGNPVYPLLWDLFGGRAFDAALNAKFKAGHALPVGVLKNPLAWIPDLWRHLVDVAVGSDWQSPLIFGLAPVSLLAWTRFRRGSDDNRSSSKDLAVIVAFAAWLFLTWWALTHRIDRFWVPMLPVLAVLAGIGLSEIASQRSPRSALATLSAVVIAAVTWYHLAFISSPFIGFNGYLMNESVARRIAESKSAPAMTIVNSLPDDAKVLLVGEAQVFEARRPVIYSTVFNHNAFEELFRADASSSTAEMRPNDELRAILKVHGITHILVNWNEVLRYRTTYGYSDFVTPGNVRAIAALGLAEELPLPRTIPPAVKVEDTGESTQFQLSTWGKDLVRPDPEGDWYPAYELWRVID